MAKSESKIKAVEMRRCGHTVGDIAKKLGVSKGSVSNWTKNIKLTKKQRDKIREKVIKSGSVGRVKGSLKNKLAKQNRIDEADKFARKDISKLSKKEKLILFQKQT